MILVRNIRLPLSAGEPQAFEKALHAARIPRGKVQHLVPCKYISSVSLPHGSIKSWCRFLSAKRTILSSMLGQ